MTDKKALEVLESWLRLAYHNADGTDDDSAELYEALQTTFALINRQQAEIERLNIRNKALTAITKNYDWKFEKAKAEAVKEFAERLKDETCQIKYGGHTYIVVDIDDIDNLVKGDVK